MCSEFKAVNKMSTRDYRGKVYFNFFTTGVTPSSYLSQFRNALFVCHKYIFAYLLENPTGTMSDRGQRKHLVNNFKDNKAIQGTVFSIKKQQNVPILVRSLK